ncbi:SPOSA6832_00887 [Sporobolomyces salmonicolor]|uniref:SPOSA6832_00887-mRNA-1:cds n=1 Tax=Sporidiobolus salmonicolor TaxID=5005 RepID=A0A0D6EH73_SPOSA|nr:SPOSA6832_00887 [Sporobolomyces salmonicolor]
MADQVSSPSATAPPHLPPHARRKQVPPQSASSSSRPRPTPAEHAAKAFAPQEIPAPPVTVRGPFVSTAEPTPLPPSPSLADPSPPPPGPDTSSPPATDSLPSPSSPPEAVPLRDEIDSVGVEIVLDDKERQDAEAWNRERIERRLRGEYERMGQQLAEIVNDNLDAPLRLNSIRFLGAKTTRPSFLSQLVAPYLTPLPPPSFLSSSFPSPPPPSQQTLRTLLKTTRDLTATLEKFDIFRPGSIEAGLVQSESVLSGPDEVDLVFSVKEQPKYFLRTATDVGDGEGSATATAKIRNAFGGGETIEGNVSFGTRTKSAFQVRLDTPVNASPITRFDLSIFSAQRDLNYYASSNEATKGMMARLRTLSPFGYHEVAYEAVLRQIGDVAPTASMSIRDAAGASVKSAISHTFTRDTRDDPFIAIRGLFVKLKQEYAGLGGDANFLKFEQEGSLSRPIGGGYSFSLGARTGLLLPFPSSASTYSRSLFPDRFHLGGPTSVRQFRPNSMGPRDNNDYLGGEAFWALGASLVTPIWRRHEWPLKGHVWVNAGKLAGGDRPFASLFSSPSLTAGFGVLYRHSLVRVEANIGVPLAMSKGEGAVKGLQFGLGLSFL